MSGEKLLWTIVRILLTLYVITWVSGYLAGPTGLIASPSTTGMWVELIQNIGVGLVVIVLLWRAK